MAAADSESPCFWREPAKRALGRLPRRGALAGPNQPSRLGGNWVGLLPSLRPTPAGGGNPTPGPEDSLGQ